MSKTIPMTVKKPKNNFIDGYLIYCGVDVHHMQFIGFIDVDHYNEKELVQGYKQSYEENKKTVKALNEVKGTDDTLPSDLIIIKVPISKGNFSIYNLEEDDG